MPVDANGWGRPGRDERDDDLTPRERQALANENSGSQGRREQIISRRAGAEQSVKRK